MASLLPLLFLKACLQLHLLHDVYDVDRPSIIYLFIYLFLRKGPFFI